MSWVTFIEITSFTADCCNLADFATQPAPCTHVACNVQKGLQFYLIYFFLFHFLIDLNLVVIFLTLAPRVDSEVRLSSDMETRNKLLLIYYILIIYLFFFSFLQSDIRQAQHERFRFRRSDLGGRDHGLYPEVLHHRRQVSGPLPPQNPHGLQIQSKNLLCFYLFLFFNV